MARARLVKPGFFSNDKLAEQPAHGRLLFVGLWTLADREGRLPDRPKWIKGSLFPYENPPVEKLLQGLADGGFIERYEVEGERFIQVVNFLKHQTPHIKEGASTIPAPDEHSASTAFSGTSPSVPISDPVPIPIAVAETETEDARARVTPEPPPSLPSLRKEWENKIGPMSPIGRDGLAKFADLLPYTWIVAAIDETKQGASRPCWEYTEKILHSCVEEQRPPQSLRDVVQAAKGPPVKSLRYET